MDWSDTVADTPPQDGAPNYLVVHEDAQVRLSIIQVLRLVDRGAAAGARTSAGAVRRLAETDRPYDAVLVHWGMPAYESMSLTWALTRAPADQRPFVLAFSGRWTEPDVRRALLLGADGILYAPINPLQVAREVHALRCQPTRTSRQGLVNKFGPRLLLPDPMLWSLPDAEGPWLDAMRGSTAPVGGATPPPDDPTGPVLTALDRALGRSIGAMSARAVAAVCADGDDALHDVAARHAMGPTRLERLVDAARRTLHRLGTPPAAIPVVMQRVVERARARADEQPCSVAYRRLRGAALCVFEGGDDAEQHRLFDALLTSLLDLEPEVLARAPALLTFKTAAHIVDHLDERAGLTMARLTLLAASIRGEAGDSTDERAAWITDLVGQAEVAPEDPLQGFIVAAAHDHERFEVDARLVGQVQRALVERAKAGDARAAEAARRVTRLVDAARPDGPIDRGRFSHVLDHIERRVDAVVESPTLRALRLALEHPMPSRSAEVTTLVRALRVDDEDHARRFASLLAAGAEAEPMTLVQLGDMVRAASTETGAAAYRPPRNVELRAWEPTRLRAHVTHALETRDLPAQLLERVDAERLAPVLAKAIDPAEADVGALAALVISTEGEEREKLLDSLMADPEAWSAINEALARVSAFMAAEDGGDAPTPEVAADDVRARLEGADLDGALSSVQHLADGDPTTVPLLSTLGMKLFEAGRAAEGVPLYERAIGIQPERLILKLNLARLRVSLGEMDRARPLLEAICAVAPGFGDAGTLLARTKISA